MPALFALTILSISVLVGCGSSSTSSASGSTSSPSSGTTAVSASAKPSYCAALSNLEASVKAIPSVDEIKKNGTSAVESAVAKVQADANVVVNEAKSDFASQTSALKTSVDTLSASVKQLSSPPTGSQLAALPAEISAVATATTDLSQSASPKCS
jgi:maltose-binding protein MalE